MGDRGGLRRAPQMFLSAEMLLHLKQASELGERRQKAKWLNPLGQVQGSPLPDLSMLSGIESKSFVSFRQQEREKISVP